MKTDFVEIFCSRTTVRSLECYKVIRTDEKSFEIEAEKGGSLIVSAEPGRRKVGDVVTVIIAIADKEYQ